MMEEGRRLGNCLTVACTLWRAATRRGWFCFRQSEGLKGLVVHCGHAREKFGGRELILVDAIPEFRKARIFQRGSFFLFFRMIFRVRRYRLTATGTGDNIQSAARDAWRNDACRHCGRMP